MSMLLYIPIWFYSNLKKHLINSDYIAFTFQSGSIQINVNFRTALNTYFFTFQSGSIQIGLHD